MIIVLRYSPNPPVTAPNGRMFPCRLHARKTNHWNTKGHPSHHTNAVCPFETQDLSSSTLDERITEIRVHLVSTSKSPLVVLSECEARSALSGQLVGLLARVGAVGYCSHEYCSFNYDSVHISDQKQTS